MAANETSPFGASTQKYWDRRQQYFSRFDEGIQTDEEGLYSVIPEDSALDQAKRIASPEVLDAFAGIGGNSIGFARSGKRVRAIESNPDRLQMAKNNARIYGVEHLIDFVLGDALDHIANHAYGAVYLDPPWGGPNYKGHGPFLLQHFQPDGRTLLEATLGRYLEVALRVPRTFQVEELSEFTRPWVILDDISVGRVVSRTVYFQ